MVAQATRIALSGGSYTSRDVSANAQKCINLFGERNPEGSPVPMTYYPTPGLDPYSTLTGHCQGLYVTGFGTVYGVFGGTLYQIVGPGNSVNLGPLTTAPNNSTQNPVRMQDNGLVLMIVDGSVSAWYLSLNSSGNPASATTKAVKVSDPNFQGSATIAVLDTFFIFNSPFSPQFYLSPSNYVGNSTPFDALYIANLTAYPDNASAVVTVGQLLWVIGLQATEVWYDVGASDFPFQRTPGVLIPYGTIAPNSVATISGNVLFLSHDARGQSIVVMGSQYSAQRVSTHAIEYAISKYFNLQYTVATTYHQSGHMFYVLTFSNDITWVFDLTTGEWHQRMSLDTAGAEHQWLATYVVNSNGILIAASATPGTANTGFLLQLNQTGGTDNGMPIRRTRSFPHMMSNGNRGIYRRFAADFHTYNNFSAQAVLSWSDDRGETFNNSLTMTIDGSANEYPSLFRLGQSRDRVFQLSWTDPNISVLNGAFVWVDGQMT